MAKHSKCRKQVVEVREYLEALLTAHATLDLMREEDARRALNEYKATQEQARNSIVSSIEHRLENLSQVQTRFADDRGTFLTRDRYDIEHSTLGNRVSALEKFQARIIGIGIVLVLFAGLVGAAIAKAFNL